MELKMDRFGRIVIPKSVRDQLGLASGSTLRLDVEKHPRHADAAFRLEQAHRGEVGLIVTTHVIAELYSTLTSLPLSPRGVDHIWTMNVRDFGRVWPDHGDASSRYDSCWWFLQPSGRRMKTVVPWP